MEEIFIHKGNRWKLVLEGKLIIVYKYDKIMDEYLAMAQTHNVKQAKDYCMAYNRDNL